jgi:hypothetical protein
LENGAIKSAKNLEGDNGRAVSNAPSDAVFLICRNHNQVNVMGSQMSNYLLSTALPKSRQLVRQRFARKPLEARLHRCFARQQWRVFIRARKLKLTLMANYEIEVPWGRLSFMPRVTRLITAKDAPP